MPLASWIFQSGWSSRTWRGSPGSDSTRAPQVAGLVAVQVALLGLDYAALHALRQGHRATSWLAAYAGTATLLWFATSLHPAMISALAALGLLFAVRRAPTESLRPLGEPSGQVLRPVAPHLDQMERTDRLRLRLRQTARAADQKVVEPAVVEPAQRMPFGMPDLRLLRPRLALGIRVGLRLVLVPVLADVGFPDDLGCGDRLGQAFELDRTDRAVAMPAARAAYATP